MAHALRTAWNARQHWLSRAFLVCIILFMLLILRNWQNDRRNMASQNATGLSSVSFDSTSMWRKQNILPWSRTERRPPKGLDVSVPLSGGTIGGVGGRFPPPARAARNRAQLVTPPDNLEHMVVRTATLDIIVADPLHAAEQLRELASHLSGFVVRSRINGSDNSTRSAQVTLRIPAKYFDEARNDVRSIAKTVEQDSAEVQDVTREYVNQEAILRNARAEELQYLSILKRATAVKDVLEVSSKIAEVREGIDQSEADQHFLQHQVEMSLLTINIRALAQVQALALHWRPLYEAKVSLRSALAGMADYADAMVSLFLNLPVLAMWGITIVALLKLGWMLLRRIVQMFIPGITTWLHRPAKPQTA
jgi:hypothetical protein